MRVKNLLLLAAMLPIGVFGQKKLTKFYAESITPGDLKKHLEVIAGDSLQGRETGTLGQRMAAEYIENHFKALGLDPAFGSSYQQEFGIDLIKPATVGLAFDEDNFSFPDNLIYLGSVSNQTFDFSEVVYVGYGVDDSLYSSYENLDVKDKVILMLAGEPKDKDGNYVLSNAKSPSIWSRNPSYKISAARERGAKLIIEVNPEFDTMLARYQRFLMRTRVSLERKSEEIEASYVIGNQDLLKKLAGIDFDALTKVDRGSVFTHDTCAFSYKSNSEKGVSSNVGGIIKGSEFPDQYLVITAHYDHLGMNDSLIFNGADDDGSGTVSVLELAEAFQMASYEGHRPKRSILFLLVSGEEKGLLGSEYFTDNPSIDLSKTICNLNIDMVGRVDNEHLQNPNYVYVIGSDMLSDELKEINEKSNKESVKISLDYRYDDPNDPNRFYYRSDHYNFAKNNIPVAFFFNGVHADYHKATDTVEKINFDKMTKINKLVFTTAWKLAHRDELLPLNAVK